MKFVTNPQLILSKDEFETLDKALKLCRDMEEQTSEPDIACTMCPFQDNCIRMCNDCVYTRAHRVLKEIIDIAMIK